MNFSSFRKFTYISIALFEARFAHKWTLRKLVGPKWQQSPAICPFYTTAGISSTYQRGPVLNSMFSFCALFLGPAWVHERNQPIGNKEIKFKQYSLKGGKDEYKRSFLWRISKQPDDPYDVTCVFDISLFQTDPKRLQAFFYNLHAKTQNMLWKSSIYVKWIIEYCWSLVWFSLNYIWIYISKTRKNAKHALKMINKCKNESLNTVDL